MVNDIRRIPVPDVPAKPRSPELLKRFEVRRIQPGDMPMVEGLLKVTWNGNPLERKRGVEPLDFTYQDIKQKYIDPGGDFLVVLKKHKILRFLKPKLVAMGGLLKIDENTGRLSKLRVHPGYQNRKRIGLGELLVEQREDKARKLGITKLLTEVEILNCRPIGLLIKKDFVITGIRPPDEKGLRFVEFEKKLK